MKKISLTLLCISLLFLTFVSPVAASSLQPEFITDKEVHGFTISPYIWDGFLPRSSQTGSVTQNEVKSFNVNVPYGTTKIEILLSWALGSSTNNLGLKIKSPDQRITGEYDDFYESPLRNGKIPLKITANPGQTLQSGTWEFIVRGKSVSSSQAFTLVVNCE